MLLRRHNRDNIDEPQVNGKPVKVEPKTKKLNKDPEYKDNKIVIENETTTL